VSRPTILAILSLPAAVIGYAVTAAILTSALSSMEGLAGLLLIVVPLFVAALCMIPFLIPQRTALVRISKRRRTDRGSNTFIAVGASIPIRKTASRVTVGRP
jgi:hypothetical protein